jgi:2-C-methyl-D-erythritol 2,4-cyclodiphosphate synthase
VASRVFLEEVRRLVGEAGYSLVNLDVTVVAQEPMLAPHLEAMRIAIAGVLGVEPAQVSVKAKSTDHLGALGRGEGVAARAPVLLEEGA